MKCSVCTYAVAVYLINSLISSNMRVTVTADVYAMNCIQQDPAVKDTCFVLLLSVQLISFIPKCRFIVKFPRKAWRLLEIMREQIYMCWEADHKCLLMSIMTCLVMRANLSTANGRGKSIFH